MILETLLLSSLVGTCMQVTWNYAGDVLRDDAAVLDFGFLAAAMSADAASGLHLSTVDLPHYVPGSLQRVREFADSCTDTAAGVKASTSPALGSETSTRSSMNGGTGCAAPEGPSSNISEDEEIGAVQFARDAGCTARARSTEADRLKRRLAAFPTTAAHDAELLALSDAALGDTERLLVAFRRRRKLALAEAIEQLAGPPLYER